MRNGASVNHQIIREIKEAGGGRRSQSNKGAGLESEQYSSRFSAIPMSSILSRDGERDEITGGLENRISNYRLRLSHFGNVKV